MAKTVVYNERDPQIAIVLERVGPGVPGRARGTHGACTECGWVMFKWNAEKAREVAQAHVDSHEAVIIGGDQDSLIR